MNNTGYSLLEVLVSTFILSIVSAAALLSIRQSIYLQKSQKQFLSSSSQSEDLRLLIQHGLHSRTWGAVPPYRIHPKGSFSTGIENTKYKPDPESMAVSFVSFNDFILSANQEGNYCFLLIKRSQELLKPQETKHWFGLSLNSLEKLSLEIRFQRRNDSHCMDKPSYSTKTKTTKSSFLFPVKESYTLYVDTFGTLRRLSHQGQNQALIYNLGPLEFLERRNQSQQTDFVVIRTKVDLAKHHRKIFTAVPFQETFHPIDLFVVLSRITK